MYLVQSPRERLCSDARCRSGASRAALDMAQRRRSLEMQPMRSQWLPAQTLPI